MLRRTKSNLNHLEIKVSPYISKFKCHITQTFVEFQRKIRNLRVHQLQQIFNTYNIPKCRLKHDLQEALILIVDGRDKSATEEFRSSIINEIDKLSNQTYAKNLNYLLTSFFEKEKL